MASIERSPAKGNLGRSSCAHDATRSTSLDSILGDPDYSDAAKRLASYLEGRCMASGKWAAWPSVPTIASDLGWDGTHYGGRKKVQRAFAELIEGGELDRRKLGDLVVWFDAEGVYLGLIWPKELPRKRRLSALVCVLNWRIPPVGMKPPRLPECDIIVPLDVAPSATELSHTHATSMSPPLNVRNLERETEPTLNVAAPAGTGEWETVASVGPEATRNMSPAAPGEAQIARWIADLKTPHKFLHSIALRALAAVDRVPPEWADKVPPPLPADVESRPAPPAPAPTPPPVSRAVEASPPPAASAPAGKPAPLVCNREKARVRGMISGLVGDPDPESERAVGRAIAGAIGDHKPKSLETFVWYAGEVRRGDLPEDALQSAFEAACGRKVRNRGKVLVDAMHRWKDGRSARGSHPSGPRPNPG